MTLSEPEAASAATAPPASASGRPWMTAPAGKGKKGHEARMSRSTACYWTACYRKVKVWEGLFFIRRGDGIHSAALKAAWAIAPKFPWPRTRRGARGAATARQPPLSDGLSKRHSPVPCLWASASKEPVPSNLHSLPQALTGGPVVHEGEGPAGAVLVTPQPRVGVHHLEHLVKLQFFEGGGGGFWEMGSVGFGRW